MSDQIGDKKDVAARANRIVMGGVAGLVAIAAIGVWLVFEFVDHERERDLENWRSRMAIVADGRAAAAQDWIDQQFEVVRGLSVNQSLQLYVTELNLGISDPEGEAAELSYLRNLLAVSAGRAGFFVAPDRDVVPANIERTGRAGLGLVGAAGEVLVASPGMPPLTAEMRAVVAQAASGEPSVHDLNLGIGDAPSMGFAAPIYAIQDDTGKTEAIGVVFGIRPVGEDLFSRLDQPGESLDSSDTYLVRRNGDMIEYLSPLADGTDPLKRSLHIETEELAAYFGVENPGAFATKKNYAGDDVLVTGRALASVPWHVVRTVGVEEAFADIEDRSSTLLTVFLLIVVLVAAALVAVWRHATSVRAAQSAERYRVTAELFTNVTEFLRAVTDNMPDPIFAVDREGKYTFANMAAAREVGLHPREMIGKLLSGVIGPVRARSYQDYNEQVILTQEPASRVLRWEENERTKIVRADHEPLPETRLRPSGALVMLTDLTEVTAERDRRERSLHQLVQTLMGVVDRRDPFSGHHSARVAEVARRLAEEMALDTVEQDAVEIAGSLINLGKLLLPRDLLTKVDELTEAERSALHESVQGSADLLEGVDFEGPVVETIRQMQAHWDGSGGEGLGGENIVVTARVLAVANAFVGMVSPRAYRDAITFNRACAILQEGAGTIFDRRPVSALVNYLDNRDGRAQWAHFGERPELDGGPSGE
jgi:PAS domain S-box-containing protein